MTAKCTLWRLAAPLRRERACGRARTLRRCCAASYSLREDGVPRGKHALPGSATRSAGSAAPRGQGLTKCHVACWCVRFELHSSPNLSEVIHGVS